MENEVLNSLAIMKHKVADYSAWRPVYDADAPRRENAGLKEVGVYRDVDDQNMVLMVMETNDASAIKAMLESPDLAEKMKEAGVISKPDVWLSKSLLDGKGIAFMRHKVADYSAWRPVYDADAPRRENAGLKEVGVYRDADDQNMVLMVMETDDASAIKAMLESPDLAEKMKEAGVISKPDVWMGVPL